MVNYIYTHTKDPQIYIHMKQDILMFHNSIYMPINLVQILVTLGDTARTLCFELTNVKNVNYQ